MRTLVLAACIVLCGACGAGAPSTDGGFQIDAGPDAGGPDAGAPLSFDAYCPLYFDAVTSKLSWCYSGPVEHWAEYLTRYDKAQRCPSMARALAAGRSVYDEEKARACLEFIDQVACDNVSNEVQRDPNSPCVQAFLGTVAVDGGCHEPFECVPGAYCTAHPGACPGVCRPFAEPSQPCNASVRCGYGANCMGGVCRINANDGEPCMGPSHGMCTPGLFCEGERAEHAGTCRPQKTAGSCEYDYECASLYYCAASSDGGAGSCTPLRRLGESCEPGACELITACAADAGCQLWPSLGGTCGIVEGEIFDCLGSYCDAPSPSTPGTCRAFKAPGDKCLGTVMGNECGEGACLGGHCVAACVGP